MEKKQFISWCQRAAKDIRYKPDREAVTQELYQHLEDRYDALTDKGLSPAEAEKQALEAMGSAEAIAPQLAEIHTPWLGYIYRLILALAVIFAVIAIYVGVAHIGSFLHTLVTTRNFESIPANHESLDYYCHPKVGQWCDGYHFRVNEAGYNKQDSVLYFDLEMIHPFGNNYTNAVYYIWAVDSLGNYYGSYIEADYDDPSRVTSSGGMGSSMIFIYNMQISGFDCDAQWIELHYDRDGRDLVLRIDLTGGDARE